jgi:hypothetical protein
MNERACHANELMQHYGLLKHQGLVGPRLCQSRDCLLSHSGRIQCLSCEINGIQQWTIVSCHSDNVLNLGQGPITPPTLSRLHSVPSHAHLPHLPNHRRTFPHFSHFWPFCSLQDPAPSTESDKISLTGYQPYLVSATHIWPIPASITFWRVTQIRQERRRQCRP